MLSVPTASRPIGGLTVRRVGREKTFKPHCSRNGAAGSLWSWAVVQDHAHTLPQHLRKRTLGRRG